MESALTGLTSALSKGGRLVDLAYAGLVHQLGITQRFFPQAREVQRRRRRGRHVLLCVVHAL